MFGYISHLRLLKIWQVETIMLLCLAFSLLPHVATKGVIFGQNVGSFKKAIRAF
jgi:hypothetical protein